MALDAVLVGEFVKHCDLLQSDTTGGGPRSPEARVRLHTVQNRRRVRAGPFSGMTLRELCVTLHNVKLS